MRITCPYCGFSKELQPDQLPTGAAKVNCPKCRQRFPLFNGMEPESQAATIGADPESGTASSDLRRKKIEAATKAGFWLRLVAALIDITIVFVLQFSLGALLTLAGAATAGVSEGTIGIMAILVQLFSYTLSFAYYIVFTGHCGQTPGKMALRIKVIRTDGDDISYGRAAFREVPAKFISGIIFCIGYLMVAFDAQKQGLHDHMAKTYVVKL